ncbi:hypothetical protein JCM6882_008797 [Rhodosporidiobolus microsporus]
MDGNAQQEQQQQPVHPQIQAAAQQLRFFPPLLSAPLAPRSHLLALFPQWQDQSEAQDELVADLLRQQLHLKEEIRKAEAEIQAHQAAAAEHQARATAQVEAAARAKAVADDDEKWKNEMRELERLERESEEELRRDRERYHDAVSRGQEIADQQLNLDSQLAELEQRREERERYGATARTKVWGKGPAQALVLINGNAAPFADTLIQRGVEGGKKASRLLREAVAADMENEDAIFRDPDIIIWLVHQQKAVSSTLVKADVISAPSTFDRFIEGFGAKSTANYVLEIERNSPAHHMAALLKASGFSAPVQRIYLVGSHPQAVIMATREADDFYEGLQEALEVGVWPKVLLVNHQLDPGLPEAVAGPTVDLGDLFNSTISSSIFGNKGRSPSSGQVASSGRSLGAPATSKTDAWGMPQSRPTSSKPVEPDWQVVGGSSAARKAISAAPVHAPIPLRPSSAINTVASSGAVKPVASGSKQSSPAEKAKGKEREKETSPPGRKINPSRGMLQQDPQICFFHYLSEKGCTNKVCDLAHDYVMTAGQLGRLRDDVAKYPCPKMRKSGSCTYTAKNDEIDAKILAKAG